MKYVLTTVEPLYNGQVGARVFVRYLEVSFIGRFHHNNVYLTPYIVKMSYYTFKMKFDTCKTSLQFSDLHETPYQ